MDNSEFFNLLLADRDMWRDVAAQHLRNEQYYNGLLIDIGKAIGEQAFIADDGTHSDEVICANLPNLVKQLVNENKNESKLGNILPKSNLQIGLYRHRESEQIFLLYDEVENDSLTVNKNKLFVLYQTTYVPLVKYISTFGDFLFYFEQVNKV